MKIEISKKQSLGNNENFVWIAYKSTIIPKHLFAVKEQKYISEQIKNGETLIEINRLNQISFVAIAEKNKQSHLSIEAFRKLGNSVVKKINAAKAATLAVISDEPKEVVLAFTEGVVLGNYQFIKYFRNTAPKKNSLKKVSVISKSVSEKELTATENICSGVMIARSLVNEPVSYLTATQLSEEIKTLGKDAGFKVEVFNKTKIASLKMGGLLAVNKGSLEPPTFSVLEWKPSGAKNKKPIVVIGKGIVYDTGGLSLKPTSGSMDSMKCDMAGAAAVTGLFYALAKNKVPVHVIGLIPATDNRPGGNAYAPGDIITMHNGLFVEVLNTDAEGRMILADALSYARKYKPELVVDMATLTGAAQRAVGQWGTILMGTADESTKTGLKESGETVYERLVEFPLWDEYAGLLKSDIADMKNIGGPNAGAITAAKFLERFTEDDKGNKEYAWIHLDIAGSAYIERAPDTYRGKGGTGVGVRLLYDYFSNKK